MMRIGIYGGTFSPIHAGHVRAAKAFLEDMHLDRLFVIPTATPPHKAEVDGASADERLEMARLAFGDSDKRIEVSDFEITRAGKSYTVFTLEHFTQMYRGDELFMLVGTDMFLTLDKWFRADDIFKLTQIVLMRREGDPNTDQQIRDKYKLYTEKHQAKIHTLNRPHLEVSSTEIRKSIAAGKPTTLLPSTVANYIQTHHLYR